MPTLPPRNSASAPPDRDPPSDDEPGDDDPRSDGDRNPFDNDECIPLPPNPMMALTDAICGLANITCCNLTSEPSQRTKCELNFQDCPCAFRTDHTKVTFAQSYLKGMALEWFKPDLLHVEDLDLCPLWMNNYHKFLLKLQTNFGPHDPVADTEHQLDNLFMKDSQRINKYIVEFNHIASQTASRTKSLVWANPLRSLNSASSYKALMHATGSTSLKSTAKQSPPTHLRPNHTYRPLQSPYPTPLLRY
ncbi:hypothetical protein PAXRUDRAFT_21839 [Paxillus rubicundulus Ve08.2h10]|uniref:Retrotransposon gag domain-containing protein n=1 Tax=Paxillus rubicundulus Ve08.2h10 TaxID=930991 RepID=A0A0D0BLM4_9AGAM|nr:hypothetical protein PAXRUDRAFT_21839 [Paxillus rubicundulus Ve08.2h10]